MLVAHGQVGIDEVALSPPRQLIGMSVWSLAKLREYLIEQGIIDSISLEWLRQILRRQRIRWRHTTPWHGSWLNRIESHFTAMRKFCPDNTDYPSHEEQQATIERYLTWRNRRRSISVKDWRRCRRAA